ncbi:MAG: four helix bundle protein [Bacteroidetes bacterium]|jgi:four helix bundle protein|nr:four helix bundle protein [Bacteroidota bacterium]
MELNMNRKDLEDRLIDFSVETAEIINGLPNTKFANHLANQLVRSCTSPALNYGETQAAESKKDFIHKMSVVLKELRESLICLKIIKRRDLFQARKFLNKLINECNELVSIFYRSIETASNRNQTDRKSLRR